MYPNLDRIDKTASLDRLVVTACLKNSFKDLKGRNPLLFGNQRNTVAIGNFGIKGNEEQTVQRNTVAYSEFLVILSYSI